VDIEKIYNSLKVISRYVDGTTTWIEADYQIDNDDTWTPLPGIFDKSPSCEVSFSEKIAVNGKRLRYRLRSQTKDASVTPEIRATVVEAIGRSTVKYAYAIKYRTSGVDLIGNKIDDIQDQLDEWAAKLTPLVMRSVYTDYDNRLVFLNPIPTAPIKGTPDEEDSEVYIGTITLIEV